MPSLHGVQGQDAGHAPSLLVKVMRERGGRQTEEPDIRGMQEGGKGGRKGIAEDLEDSLRHLNTCALQAKARSLMARSDELFPLTKPE